MAPQTPTGEPSEIVAGDSIRWRVPAFMDYPESEGWILKYRILGVQVIAEFAAVWQAAGDDAQHWLATLTSGTTDDLTPPGRYTLVGYMVGSGAYSGRSETVYSAVLIVRRDPRTATAGQFQSHAERTLALIETAIEALVTDQVTSYQVAGRAFTKRDIAELTRMRGQYASLVAQERTGRIGRPVASRFVRAS